jgi:hypothetical protein
VTILLDLNCMLFASGRNRIFLDAGTFCCKKVPAPVTIQFLKTACFLLGDETEYFRVQAPLVVVHRQMAPESVTTQPHQNHIVFSSR